MPTYVFQCQCGLRFDVRSSIKNRAKPRPCPDCGAVADLVPPETVSGQFKKEVTGPGPQNTGIHDLDTHIDRVIGQSAHQGWGVAEGRVKDKEAVLAATGATGHDLSKNPDGTYRVMSPAERAAHTRSQKIHGKATEWRTRQRPRR